MLSAALKLRFMPLLFIRNINPATSLGYWELTETPETLTKLLTAIAPADLSIPDFSSSSRQKQWLAGRLLVYTLLQQFSLEPLILQVDAYGKPFFAGNAFFLSISHTSQTVVVLLSKTYQVGIDIESVRPKVLRVQQKFMSETELKAAGGDLIKVLIYWCAKETLYKLYGRKQLIFKEHLEVKPFVLTKSGALEASVNTPEFARTVRLYFETELNYILTYCLDIPEN